MNVHTQGVICRGPSVGCKSLITGEYSESKPQLLLNSSSNQQHVCRLWSSHTITSYIAWPNMLMRWAWSNMQIVLEPAYYIYYHIILTISNFVVAAIFTTLPFNLLNV